MDGPRVTPLGWGDFHDPSFDKMVVTQDVNSYVKGRANAETRSYLTVPLHDSYGLYKLRVYPSRATEDVYTSNQPVVLTVIVAVVFLVTALVFVAQSWVVLGTDAVTISQPDVSLYRCNK